MRTLEKMGWLRNDDDFAYIWKKPLKVVDGCVQVVEVDKDDGRVSMYITDLENQTITQKYMSVFSSEEIFAFIREMSRLGLDVPEEGPACSYD